MWTPRENLQEQWVDDFRLDVVNRIDVAGGGGGHKGWETRAKVKKENGRGGVQRSRAMSRKSTPAISIGWHCRQGHRTLTECSVSVRLAKTVSKKTGR